MKRLAKGLDVATATVPIVRALFRMVKSLRPFAWNTRQLSAETLALREAFHNARSPERFLFVEVPQALGLAAFSERGWKSRDIERFFNVLNRSLREWSAAAPRALDHARDTLLEACGLPAGLPGWETLRQEALHLENSVTEPRLLAFVRRVIQASAGQPGVESVCALVASRPCANWTDTDVSRFPDVARALGTAFQEAVTVSRRAIPSADSLKELEPNERKQAQRLLVDLRTYLEKGAKRDSPRIIKAALAALVREMEEPDV